MKTDDLAERRLRACKRMHRAWVRQRVRDAATDKRAQFAELSAKYWSNVAEAHRIAVERMSDALLDTAIVCAELRAELHKRAEAHESALLYDPPSYRERYWRFRQEADEILAVDGGYWTEVPQ